MGWFSTFRYAFLLKPQQCVHIEASKFKMGNLGNSKQERYFNGVTPEQVTSSSILGIDGEKTLVF